MVGRMTAVGTDAEPSDSKGSSRLADLVKMSNGLSAARALAAILVVMLHAAIPYLVSPVPVLWLVHDTSQHVGLDVLVVAINGFVMPLFFLLAGLSIAKSSMQRPFKEFAWHRFRRLGATFFLATVLIVPLLLISWAIGLLWTERLTMGHLARMRFPGELHRYVGPLHLWFLEYLLLMSVGWSAIARFAQRWSAFSNAIKGKWTHRALGSIWAPFIFAVPTAIIFAIDVDTPFRMITPFVPDVARLLHYSVFFIAGVWLGGFPQGYQTLRAHAPLHLLIAAVTFAFVCPLTLNYFNGTLDTLGLWLLGGLQAVFAWCMVFGFLGAMMRWCSGRHESVRYTNEASFWLYLAHFPIVCAMQLVVWQWQLNPFWKLLIVASTGVSVSLLIYQYCVRYSWLGAVINGRRKQHVTSSSWRVEAPWMCLATVGTLLFAVLLYAAWNSVAGPNVHPVVAGRIYRSNRLKASDLEHVITRDNIRSVISLAPGDANDNWFQSQQDVCDKREISLTALAINEYQVPTRADLEQLQLALKTLPRPVLLIGGNRSPTLSGFGSAVAVLVEDGSTEEALEQFSMRFFQLDGPEHCIVAQPLRDYRDWLKSNGMTDSADRFCQWTQQGLTSPAKMAAAGEQESDLQR